MSITYSDLPGTQYPDKIDTFESKVDADIMTYPFVKQYKELFNQGNVTAARALLDTYPQLKNLMISADDFNNLQDAMIAMERFMKRSQQQVLFSATEPQGSNQQSVGDIWINTSEGNALYLLTETGYVNQGTIGENEDYLTKDEFQQTISGTWIDFTDEDGNETDEPWIHWAVDENGKPVKCGFVFAETTQF